MFLGCFFGGATTCTGGVGDGGRAGKYTSGVDVIFVETMVVCVAIVVSLQVVNGERVNRLAPRRLIVAVLISRITVVPLRSGKVPLTGVIIPVLVFISLRVLISTVSVGDLAFHGLIRNGPVFIVEGNGLSRGRVEHLHLAVSSLASTIQRGKFFSLSSIRSTIVRAGNAVSILRGTRRDPMAPGRLSLSISRGSAPIPTIASKGPAPRCFNRGGVGLDRVRLLVGRDNVRVRGVVLLAISSTNGVFVVPGRTGG